MTKNLPFKRTNQKVAVDNNNEEFPIQHSTYTNHTIHMDEQEKDLNRENVSMAETHDIPNRTTIAFTSGSGKSQQFKVF